MKNLEKKYIKDIIDVDYILEKDKIVRYLLDYDRHYSLSDLKIIKKLLKKLLKILERGI